jgi:hypothetical protein
MMVSDACQKHIFRKDIIKLLISRMREQAENELAPDSPDLSSRDPSFYEITIMRHVLYLIRLK